MTRRRLGRREARNRDDGEGDRDDVEEVEVRKYESDSWRKMARAGSPASMDFASRAKLMGVASTEDGPEQVRLRRWTSLPERNPGE